MNYTESMVRELIQGDDRSKWIAHSNHNVKHFTQYEIIRITKNYETLLGRGSFGEVYRGILEDKSVVAVKRFINNVKENFAKELTIHREINHKNVVRLVGYCLEENALMMVTEYIPKGNLSDVLHRDNTPIPLDTRLRIAIECAEALDYMHSQMYTQVIHGDIKPANILLDDELRAKISDFGISRLVSTENTLYTRNVIGSIGYMDPMFARTGRLTAKSDVYSFGVVLLELVTRKKARKDGEIDLLENFTKAHAKGIRRVREMFDSEIAILGNMKTIEQVAQLAGECLRLELDKRPEMLEVVEHLRGLRKALRQRQERLDLFSWGKYLLSLAEIITSQESSSNIQETPSLESSTNIQKKTSQESSGNIQKNISQESNSNIQKRGTFITSSAMTCPLFELEDLLRGSAEVLGKGTVGTTYIATLETGVELVVKRLKVGHVRKEEFELRVTVIGAIQNKHIAPLQWYYCSRDEQLLVYNIFPIGSLAHALHGDRVSDPAPLDWEQRAAILIAVARGVASIHSAGPSSCHGNIKSSNVLLSSTYDACVSEHGLITLGVFPDASGYRAPEVTNNKLVSQEADVYSFGILLLEVLTGKAPVKSTQHDEGVDLPQWVRSVIHEAQEEWAAEVLDVEIRTMCQNGWTKDCMEQLLQVALKCCSQNAESRPTMSDVVRRIEEIGSSRTLIFGCLELKDLLRARREVLGKDRIGTSYKAVLESGFTLVIKKLMGDLPKEEFLQRVTMIGAIRNDHISTLWRYFYSKEEKLVVYSYFPKGSLAHMLHARRLSGPATLDWGQRIAISLAAARGVSAIHSTGPSSCHGNIKSSNVLLSSTHDACVSEHGLITLGVFPEASGYSAPEIIDAMWVSQKADVYSFGVLLLELLTCKVPVKTTQHDEGVDLPEWVRSVIFREAHEEWAADVFDLELQRLWQKDGEKECMVRLLRLALKCCSEDANSRPTMSDVVQRIEGIQRS